MRALVLTLLLAGCSAAHGDRVETDAGTDAGEDAGTICPAADLGWQPWDCYCDELDPRGGATIDAITVCAPADTDAQGVGEVMKGCLPPGWQCQ